MKSVEFQPPAGVVPEGTQAGEDFDMVSTYRVKGNGTVCLVMLGDAKMPGYDDKSEHKSGYSDYAGNMMAQGDKMGMAQE